MIAAVAAAGLVLAILWRLPRLIRAPYDLATRCVVAALVLWTISFPVEQAALDPATRDDLGDGGLKLVSNLLKYSALWALGLFFLFAGHGPYRHVRRQARRETAVLAVAMLTIITAMLATPPEMRNHSFNSGNMQIPGIAAFYFLGGVYFVYMLSRTSIWAWQYSRESEIRMRWGLRLSSVGLAIMAIVSAVRAVYIVIRAVGGVIPHVILTAPARGVTVGLILFFTGVIIPAALIRVSAIRRWWQNRKALQEMRPLWALLHTTYPQNEFLRTYGEIQERLALWRVNRRYWRRRIEIRDGLVQVSPHLADLGFSDHDPPERQSELLRTALDRVRNGIEPSCPNAVLVAAPTDCGDDPLVTLARAVRGGAAE